MGIGGDAIVVCIRATPAAVPDTGTRPPPLEATDHKVLRMREIGADEADLHLNGGPETAGYVRIWRVINICLCVLREKRV